MYVYIILSGVVWRFEDVTLRELSVPQCGHVIKDGLDPSLWFKTLVLDSVLVDCDLRNVFWNRDHVPENEDIHGYKHSQLRADLVRDFFHRKEQMFDETELPEYDPNFDDLFETTVRVAQEAAVENGMSVAIELLFKVLHVFVLPKLTIKKVDRKKVKRILGNLEVKHCDVDKEMRRALKSEQNTETSLNEQTREMLRKDDSFSRSSYVASCDTEFLDVFLELLNKHVSQGREELAKYAEKIEPIRNSEQKEDQKQLKLLRSERDILHEGFKKAIVVHAEISSHVINRTENREHVRKSSFDFQISYVKTYRSLQIIRMQVRKLIHTKIRMSAVREAMLFTLKEIENDGFSYGYCNIKGSPGIDAGIIEIEKTPEDWATLPVRIANLLQNSKERYMVQHSEFCETITRKCHKITQALRERDGSRDSMLMAAGIPYTSRWSTGSVSKDTCESLCLEVNGHISEMSDDISNRLKNDFKEGSRVKNKVYKCYGENVLAKLFPVLTDLYEESYKDLVQDLSKWMTQVPLERICSGNIKILSIIQRPQRQDRLSCEDEEEHVYDTPNCFPQPNPKMRSPLYESMRKMPEAPDRALNPLTECPEDTADVIQESKETDSAQVNPRAASACEIESVVVRKRKVSQKKRQGMSLTADQADKLLSDKSAQSATSSDSLERLMPSGEYVDMMSNLTQTMRQLYMEFCDFEKLVTKEIEAETMSAKLRAMTDIIKNIESKLSTIKAKAGDNDPACADDLLDMVIFLLCRLDSKDLAKLYAHINLLMQLCPKFMDGNIHSYALTTLCGGYVHLFEQAKHRVEGVEQL